MAFDGVNDFFKWTHIFIMVSVAFKNRTRDEIIAAFRESIRKKHEWQERADEEIRQIRLERQQFSI
jgi:2-oxo-4-hydroxy-4-carboxy--5-ureidoimidazoline (OHCU) decarboxylase